MRPYQDAERIAADPAVRPNRLLLRTGHRRRDPRRVRIPHPACRSGRSAAPHPRDERPLPRLLLRRAHSGAAGPRRRCGAMTRPTVSTVAIVGGGPSGLTAAAALAPTVDGEVLVLEREAETGGIPRHSDHPGYGMRDLKRFISGPPTPGGSPRWRRTPARVLETEAMVTGWGGERRTAHHLTARDPHGHGRRGRPGHRRAGTAPTRPAHPRRPPRRGVHHRAVAEPGAPAPRPRR